MPAIQVYKGNGAMIPVADAKQAKAYRCPWTGGVFATKKAYVNHLKTLRTQRMHVAVRNKRWQRLGEDLWEQHTFDSIVRWIETHPDWFLDNAKRRGWVSDAKRYDSLRGDFDITVTYLRLRWNDCVSNSHQCPHDGVTKWGSSDVFNDGTPKPNGYPGWVGRIEYRLSHELPGFSSEMFTRSRVCIGNGGSGCGVKYGYDVKFFASDWPELTKDWLSAIDAARRQYEAENLVDMLKKRYVEPFSYPEYEYRQPMR
jgi:uncharacterized C2H2 Zn-finger protein